MSHQAVLKDLHADRERLRNRVHELEVLALGAARMLDYLASLADDPGTAVSARRESQLIREAIPTKPR